MRGTNGSDLEYRYEVVAILIDWITLIVSGVLLSVFFRRAGRQGHPATEENEQTS